MNDYTITTRALDATDTEPRKIRATAENGTTVTRPYPHGLDGDEAHSTVALGLARQIEGGDDYRMTVVNVRATGYEYRVLSGSTGAEEEARGCSCGMADYDAPGHDGDKH